MNAIVKDQYMTEHSIDVRRISLEIGIYIRVYPDGTLEINNDHLNNEKQMVIVPVASNEFRIKLIDNA